MIIYYWEVVVAVVASMHSRKASLQLLIKEVSVENGTLPAV